MNNLNHQLPHWSSPERVNLGRYVQDACNKLGNSRKNVFVRVIAARFMGCLAKPIVRVVDIVAHGVLGTVKIATGITIMPVIKVWDFCWGKEAHYNWTLSQGIHHYAMSLFCILDIPLSFFLNFKPDLYLKVIRVNACLQESINLFTDMKENEEKMKTLNEGIKKDKILIISLQKELNKLINVTEANLTEYKKEIENLSNSITELNATIELKETQIKRLQETKKLTHSIPSNPINKSEDNFENVEFLAKERDELREKLTTAQKTSIRLTELNVNLSTKNKELSKNLEELSKKLEIYESIKKSVTDSINENKNSDNIPIQSNNNLEETKNEKPEECEPPIDLEKSALFEQQEKVKALKIAKEKTANEEKEIRKVAFSFLEDIKNLGEKFSNSKKTAKIEKDSYSQTKDQKEIEKLFEDNQNISNPTKFEKANKYDQIDAKNDIAKLFNDTESDFQEYIDESEEDTSIPWNTVLIDAQIAFNNASEKTGKYRMYVWEDKEESESVNMFTLPASRSKWISALNEMIGVVLEKNPKGKVKVPSGNLQFAKSTILYVEKEPQNENIIWALKLLQIARSIKYLRDVAKKIGKTADILNEQKIQEEKEYKKEQLRLDILKYQYFIRKTEKLEKIFFLIEKIKSNATIEEKNYTNEITELKLNVNELISQIDDKCAYETKKLSELLVTLKNKYVDLYKNYDMDLNKIDLKSNEGLDNLSNKLFAKHENLGIKHRKDLDKHDFTNNLDKLLSNAENYILFLNNSKNIQVKKILSNNGGLIDEIYASRSLKSNYTHIQSGHSNSSMPDIGDFEEEKISESEGSHLNIQAFVEDLQALFFVR